MWKPNSRNFDGIQHENLRKKIDQKYNDLHDELSACYYSKKPFRNYGILDKTTFDKLHGIVFLKRDIEFHTENLKQSKSDRIPLEEYEHVFDSKGNITGKKSEVAKKRIEELKKEGLEL